MQQVEVDREGNCEVLIDPRGTEVEEDLGLYVPVLGEAGKESVVQGFAVLFPSGDQVRSQGDCFLMAGALKEGGGEHNDILRSEAVFEDVFEMDGVDGGEACLEGNDDRWKGYGRTTYRRGCVRCRNLGVACGGLSLSK